MRKATYFLAFLFMFQMANAQIHEIGIFAGGSNYIGDVGRTVYVYPRHIAYGVLYKWNKNPRYSWRFSLTHSLVGGNDYASSDVARKQRGLHFENPLTEISAGFEFNFFDFNLHERPFFSTPYLYTGLSYFSTDLLYVKNSNYFSAGNTSKFAIPIIAGIKMKIADKYVLAFEAGARYAFTDNIDGSNPKNSSYENLKFGNTSSNDWYVFSGLTLTYTFGHKPCYCIE
jgi:hypothetical protein